MIASIDHFLHPVGDFAALILAVAALIFAFVQLRHSRHIIQEAANIVSKSDVIAKALSTRFVGQFPKNMGAILEVLSHATSHVEIMVDIVAYGHYSDPGAFMKYRQQLEELAKNEKILLNMVVQGPTLIAEGRRRQFKPEDFPGLQATTEYKQFIKKKSTPKDYEAFIELLAKEETYWEDHIRRQGASISPCEDPFPLFLWLVDDREAVFSFQTYGEHYHEICFRTLDGNLVKAFSELVRSKLGGPVATAAVTTAPPAPAPRPIISAPAAPPPGSPPGPTAAAN